MHIVHLACAPDCICSCLLDLTDGGSRDSQLANLWSSYHNWCEAGRTSVCKIWAMFFLKGFVSNCLGCEGTYNI